MPPQLVAAVNAAAPSVQLYLGSGPAEAAAFASMYPLNPKETPKGDYQIGRTIPNVKVRHPITNHHVRNARDGWTFSSGFEHRTWIPDYEGFEV